MPEKRTVLTSDRILSIDVFRALTMMLMIFVNDLWTLRDIPEWLEHKPASADGMGLADIVFPAFLFIVGLSVPYAISKRKEKGDSVRKILIHIVERSFALICMGFFMVNLESLNNELLLFNRLIWQLLMAFAFFLIWTDYRFLNRGPASLALALRSSGVLILLFLAVIYKGGPAESPEWMKTSWWGILGLIGWAYLLSSLVYLLTGNRILLISIALLVFYILNLQEFVSPWETGKIRIIIGASNYASVMAGVWVSVLMMRYITVKDSGKSLLLLFSVGAVFIIYGFLVRPAGGISKIHGTPSWTAICSGISTLTFAFLYLLSDIWSLNKWHKLIKPAGTSTLTCYLIPYFSYAIVALAGFSLPLVYRTGIVGILKSLVFSLMIIFITGLLERLRIRLKI